METTLERQDTHTAVGFGTAFLEQFRLLWISRRPLLMLVGMIGILALFGRPWNDPPVARLFIPFPIWGILLGPFWAFAVWHNEGPGDRLYFWSHPVSRTAHSLARLTAGAAWLLALYAVLIAAGLLFAVFDGNLDQFAVVGPTAWVSFFTGPLIGYLIISVLTISSDHPVRWFLIILFGLPILGSLLVQAFGLQDQVLWALDPVIDRRWGLGVSMFLPFIVAYERVEDFATGGVPDGGSLARSFEPGSWWLTMLLWLLFWTLMVVLLARRHPDAFPRWHRFR